jgi:hypothetical protein
MPRDVWNPPLGKISCSDLCFSISVDEKKCSRRISFRAQGVDPACCKFFEPTRYMPKLIYVTTAHSCVMVIDDEDSSLSREPM